MKLIELILFGESHGKAVGVVVKGIPPSVPISEEELAFELERRKGIKGLSTARKEPDKPQILSGVKEGYTTGTPIAVIVKNKDVISDYYEEIKNTPRPGHADYTARIKYFSYNDYRGGGHFSGRLTIGYVVAGYIAKKALQRFGIKIKAFLRSVGKISARDLDVDEIIATSNPFCPDEEAFRDMKKEIIKAKKAGDSIGGVVEVVAINVPPGLGGPYGDDIEAELSKWYYTIPAVKAVEFGLGLKVAELRGSQVNDPFILKDGRVITETNNAGGILGGITSGMPIIARIAFKPTPSIYLSQRTVDLKKMKEITLKLKGRFDPCIAPKALPVVEGVTALVILDKLLERLAWEKFLELSRTK